MTTSHVEANAAGLGAAGPVTSLKGKYKAKASNPLASSEARDAASLFLEAELRINGDPDYEHGLKAARECAELYRGMGMSMELGDALRLLVHAHYCRADYLRLSDDKDAVERCLLDGEQIARQEAINFSGMGDARGEGCMFLAEAELNWNGRGKEKTAEALRLATDARVIFAKIGDTRLEATAIMMISNAHFLMREYSSAQALIQEAIAMCHDVGDYVGEGHCLHALACSQFNSYAIKEALETSKKTAVAFRAADDIRMLACNLHVVAGWYLQVDDPRSALPLSREALELFRKDGRVQHMEAMALTTLVDSLLALGEFERAEKVSQDGLQRLRDSGASKRDVAEALRSVLSVQLSIGDIDAALRAADESIEICREHGLKYMEAIFQQELAAAYAREGKWPDAEMAADDARRLFEDTEASSQQLTEIEQFIARAQLEQNHVNEALDSAKEAIRLSKETGDRDFEAFAILNNCSAYAANGDYEKFESSVRDAIAIFMETGNKRGEGRGRRLLAEIHRLSERYEEALEAARTSVELVREAGDKKWEAKSLQTIAHVHVAKGSPKEAIRPALQAVKLCKFAEDYVGATNNCFLLIQAHCSSLNGDPRMSARKSKECLDKALKACKEGVGLAARVRDVALKGHAQYWLGRVCLLLGRVQDATGCATTALDLSRKAGDEPGAVRALLLSGWIRRHMDEEPLAKRSFQEALEQAERIRYDDGVALARDALGAEAGPRAQAEGPKADATSPDAVAAPMPEAGAGAAEKAYKPPDAAAVRARIQQIVQTVAGSGEEFEDDTPLMESGIDSLAAVELRTQMVKEFGVTLPSTVMFNYPSIGTLTQLLVNECTTQEIAWGA